MSKEHQKHAKLARPADGEWGRVGIALMGAPCAIIEQLAAQVINCFSGWNIGFVDATHVDEPQAAQSAAVHFTQTGDGAEIHMNKLPDRFSRRALFNDCDLVLVNGNHFMAQHQVILLHPEKSLEKKLDKLTDVKLAIAASADTPVPEYLQAILEGVPRITLDDTDGLADFFKETLSGSIPPLNGLVLAGGQSLRMGSDKGLLQYHAKPQRIHVFELLQPLCQDVFVSCNAAQAGGLHLPEIEDRFLGIGPVAGILSAFQSAPGAAWLTVATDLPHLSSATLEYLIAHRNPSKLATAFVGADGLPEPLITIWEPRAYPVLLQALGMGITCPRKMLMSCDIERLLPPAPEELRNVNLPAEREAAMAAIHNNPVPLSA